MFYYDRMTRLLAIYIHIRYRTKHRATGVHVRTEYIAVSTGDRPTEVDDLIHPIFFRRIYYAQKLFQKTLMHIYLLWLYMYVPCLSRVSTSVWHICPHVLFHKYTQMAFREVFQPYTLFIQIVFTDVQKKGYIMYIPQYINETITRIWSKPIAKWWYLICYIYSDFAFQLSIYFIFSVENFSKWYTYIHTTHTCISAGKFIWWLSAKIESNQNWKTIYIYETPVQSPNLS